MPLPLAFRRATIADAPCLSMLATQVFLDTYATQGVSSDLANEARTAFSLEVCRRRLAEPTIEITVATVGESLVGFVDLVLASACPVQSVRGAEVLRLYVQRHFRRRGVGSRLMSLAEAAAARHQHPALWLTAWVGHAQALTFYARSGYQDVGATDFVIEGKACENRVFAKQLQAVMV